VILHVAVAGDGVGDVVLGELLEERVEGLAQDAAEDVEAAAVGHAHDDLLDAGFGAVVDDGIERRDGGLAALEGEAFLADVFGVEKFLEQLGLVDAAEDADLERLGELRLEAGGLDALLEPAAGVLVSWMCAYSTPRKWSHGVCSERKLGGEWSAPDGAGRKLTIEASIQCSLRK
jgi:hypothetical protein